MISAIYENLEEYKPLEHGFYPNILEAGFKYHASRFPGGIREAIDKATIQISETFGISSDILYDEILVQDRDDDGYVDFDLGHFSDIYKKAVPENEWIFFNNDEFRSLFLEPEQGPKSSIFFTEFFDDSSKKQHMMTSFLKFKAMLKFGKPLHDIPGIIQWFQNKYNGNINSEADLERLAIDLRDYLENAFFHPTVDLDDDYLRDGGSLESLSSTSDGRIRIDCGGFQYIAEQILSSIQDANGNPLFTIERFHTPGHVYNIAYTEDSIPGLLLETNNEYVGTINSSIEDYAEAVALVNKDCLRDNKEECSPLTREKVKGHTLLSKKALKVTKNPIDFNELSIELTHENTKIGFSTNSESISNYLRPLIKNADSSLKLSLGSGGLRVSSKANGYRTTINLLTDSFKFYSELSNSQGKSIAINWDHQYGLMFYLIKDNKVSKLTSFNFSSMLVGLVNLVFGKRSKTPNQLTAKACEVLEEPISKFSSFKPASLCKETEKPHCSTPLISGFKQGANYEEKRFAFNITETLSKYDISKRLNFFIPYNNEVPDCKDLSFVVSAFRWVNAEWYYSTYYETSCKYADETYSKRTAQQKEISPDQFHQIEELFQVRYKSE